MADSRRVSELFEILRHLAIVSAALNHDATNRNELLVRREMLVQAAGAMGFHISEAQQRALCGRLSAIPQQEEGRRATRDHGEILAWAMEHDAVPAEVRRPVFDTQPSALRFLSGGAKTGTPEIRPISWEDFFARFDLMRWSVVLEDERADYEFIPAPPSPKKPFDEA